jgi:uncharacterized protein
MFSVAYIVLAFAIACLLSAYPKKYHSRHQSLCVILLVSSCGVAVLHDIVRWDGIVVITTCAALLRASTLQRLSAPVANFKQQLTGRFLLGLGLICALAIGLHLPQGAFNNHLVVSLVRITPDAIPYTLYLNFDKGIAGALLLLLVVRTAASFAHLVRAIKSAALISGVTLALFVPLILFSGYARYAPKWPDFALTFLFANIFFTVVAEECFFRGVIQERIHRMLEVRNLGNGWHLAAILVLSLPFALSHISHSWTGFVLIVLAGCAYGYAYLRTRSIESPIVVHSVVNTVHFFFFTYPQVQA